MQGSGSSSRDNSDWTRTWERAAALATSTLSKLDGPQPARVKVAEPRLAPALVLKPKVRDQLARDIAEIERAAAALRRLEPSLEPRLPDAQAQTQLCKMRSIWVLVGMTWFCTASVASCAIGAIILLFG